MNSAAASNNIPKANNNKSIGPEYVTSKECLKKDTINTIRITFPNDDFNSSMLEICNQDGRESFFCSTGSILLINNSYIHIPKIIRTIANK